LISSVLDSSVPSNPSEHAAALFLHGVFLFVRSSDSIAAARSFRDALALRLDLAGDWMLGLDPSLDRAWRRARRRVICGTAEPAVSDLLDEPHALTPLVQRPRVLSAPRLHFPIEVVRPLKWEGRVVAAAVIDTAGHVEPGSVKILRSPDSRFDREVHNWLVQALFQPARTDEGAVRACIEVPVVFRLRP
jgi:TonB family protein